MTIKFVPYKQVSNFFVPENLRSLEDIGGKAEHLIKNEDKILAAGFKLPTAVCMPWYELISIPEKNGIDVKNFSPEFDYDHKEHCFKFNLNERQNEFLRFVMDNIANPFFSSSAYGEDSLEARFPGVYFSSDGFNMDKAKKWGVGGVLDFFNMLDGFDNEETKKLIESYNKDENKRRALFENFVFQVNKNRIGSVVESYYSETAAVLRQKHKMPEKGMGIIVRETIGGDMPKHSYVAHTAYGKGVLIAVAEGWGGKIVDASSEHVRTLFSKDYEIFVNQCNGEVLAQPTIVDNRFEVGKFAKKLSALEQMLAYPDTHGVDVEVSTDEKNDFYLLQCPPIKQVVFPKIDDNAENLFSYPREVSGAGIKQINGLVVLDTHSWVDQRYREEVLEKKLFDINRSFSGDYVLLTSPIISHSRRLHTSLWCNAAGIVESRDLSSFYPSAHIIPSVSHYDNFLRSEGISLVNGSLAKNLLDLIEAFKPATDDEKDIKVIPVNMTLETNERTQQARLYFNEEK